MLDTTPSTPQPSESLLNVSDSTRLGTFCSCRITASSEASASSTGSSAAFLLFFFFFFFLSSSFDFVEKRWSGTDRSAFSPPGAALGLPRTKSMFRARVITGD
jgi:hypothetical protein